MRRWREAPTLLASLALVTALLLVLLAGCAPAWPFPQPTADPKVPDAQQIFRPLEIGPNAGDLATLDPALINFAVDEDKAQLLFPALVTLDAQGKPVDWAAERHEVSADGLTYTFHLHKGMQWSDGSPIDANTFAYSINRALDPCTGSDVASYLYLIQGAEAYNTSACPVGSIKSTTMLIGTSLLVRDPLTLQIRLEHPAGYFLAALTYPASWGVPQSLVERYTTRAPDPQQMPPTASTWTDHLADNGGFGGNLFKLTRWDHAGHLDFARNERFWGQKPLLKEIQYTLFRDPTGEWSTYEAGTGDVGSPPTTQIDAAKTLRGSTFHQMPQLAFSYLTPNWKLAPFDDVRVRQAFSLALDRAAIAHDVLKDAVQPTVHLVPEGMPGYNPDLADAAGRRGEDALTPDLANARRLASSYAAEKCSGNYARCPLIIFTVLSYQPALALVTKAIVDTWQGAFPGWPIDATDGCRLQICSRRAFQLATANWGADYADPQDFISLLWTTNAPYDQTFVSIPQVDQLCAQADGMSDLSARIPLYQQAEQLLVNQVAAIPYAQPLNTYVVRSRVVGWRVAPTGQTPLSVWRTAYLTK
jgi:oligopeptide transport system substrate-binding protein